VLIGDILRLTARRYPNKTAVVCDALRLSYAALDAAANRFANAVLAAGAGKGDTVAIVSRNSAEYLIVNYGVARTGALLVNVMPGYAPPEMAEIFARTTPKIVVTEAEAAAKAQAALAEAGLTPLVVVADGAGFDDFVAGAPDAAPDVALSEDDAFAMTFTGGTTGRPKGAVVSHRARSLSSWTTAVEHEITGGDVVGVLTPLYHAMGLLIWLNAAVLMGATCVVLRGWDPDGFTDACETHGISNVIMVPVQLAALLSDAHFAPDRLKGLTRIGCGGATTPPALFDEVARKMPWARFINHYGQSETGPLTMLRPSDPPGHALSVGRPAVGVEMDVVDDAGNSVPSGAVGEIVLRGPNLMQGYYNDADETAAFFRNGDGWGWTGDLATVDSDGFVTLVGRSKDMIVSGGVNVYPREVELALERHDAVAECSVIGVPDSKWGEALVALVVRRGGAVVDEAALIGWCDGTLARFKRPKHWRFVDAIPKTPSGKVQKPKLREELTKSLGLG
jgi:fatty-acyl-CoA synthase